MLTPDQERIRSILYETITSICRNGLHFDKELRVDALIGVTIDQQEVFLITVNEAICHSEYSGCLNKKGIFTDHTSNKSDSANHYQPAATSGLSRIKSSRKSVDLESRIDCPSELEQTPGISDCRGRTLATDGVLNDIHNAGNSSLSEHIADQLSCGVSVNSDPVCLEGQLEESASSRLNSNHVDTTGHLVTAAESLPNDTESNASSTKDDDDDDPVIFVKQEQGELDDAYERGCLDLRPVGSRGYVGNSAYFAGVSSGSGTFRQHTVDKDECSILNKQRYLLPSKSCQKTFQHHMTSKSGPYRQASLCGPDALDSGHMLNAHHRSDDLPGQYSETSGQLYRRQRCRSLLLPYQINRLNRAFAQSQYLTSEMKAQLAEELQLKASVIGIWFQNRRYKLKKKYQSYQS